MTKKPGTVTSIPDFMILRRRSFSALAAANGDAPRPQKPGTDTSIPYFIIAAILLVFVPPAQAQQLRAFWADAYHSGYKTPDEVTALIDNATAALANTILIEVRRDGGAYYLQSPEPPPEDASYTPGFDALQDAIDKAHARGLEVHAWLPVMPLWRSSVPPVDRRHLWYAHGPSVPGDAMWMTTNSAGKPSGSLDPGHPDAAKYLADLVVALAAKYKIDGVHLDYVRYPEDDNYGWNPRAVARFNRLYNRSGSPGASDTDWADFRRDQVTALVRQIYLRSMELDPKLKISGALITWGDGPASDAAFRSKDAYSRVFQDWRAWLEEGILDIGMPMNYFREGSTASMLDRWLAFEKTHQYTRAIAPGIAPYLNSIPDSIKQLDRVLAPNSSGNSPLGVVFYSYASTNTLDAAGSPMVPNTEFYKALAGYFQAGTIVPGLPWKTNPEKGHVLGTVTLIDGDGSWNDGVGVRIESDTGRPFSVNTKTDGTGFFGAVDLPPDRYRVRLLCGGLELFRTVSQDIKRGTVTRFDIQLTAGDFNAIRPRITEATPAAAAPGQLVTLNGTNFAGDYAAASAVPLPIKLNNIDVLVNGAPAALSFVSPSQLQLQLPFQTPDKWNVTVRRDTMQSEPMQLDVVPARPEVLGVNKFDKYWEIYLTGLGMVDPAPRTGAGGNAQEPFNRTTLPIETNMSLLYSGLAPYQPYVYQVNVAPPPPGVAPSLSIAGIPIRLP